MYSIDNQLKIEDFVFPFGELDKNNRWVKLADIIPWFEFEQIYSEKFINNGRPSKPFRIVLGSLIIKQKLNCSDRETVSAIAENPYLQYFIGLKEFQQSAPFGASSMVEFRKRISDEMIIEMNEIILESEASSEDIHDDDNNDNTPKNEGTILMDATCTPADITYPQDLNLLNSAREKLEGYIDCLHDSCNGKKPRTYRKTARKEFLNVSKCRKKSGKKLRKAIRKQLNYIIRDIRYIEEYLSHGKDLNQSQSKEYEVILQLYEQQRYMFDNRKHTVNDRIVSIAQPHVRPIVRGKTKSPTEFGAKVEISVVDGYVRMERLSWDAYNESESLIPIVENYKERNGVYPERILADKIYRNRNNLSYCKEHGISITGPALGRPKKNKDKFEKKQEYIDTCERNEVEGKFGTSKTKYGLNRIFAKLKETAQSVINMAFFVMNLDKKLRVILRQILSGIFWCKII
ncbi:MULTISPECIES: IS5 family transposase [Clostridium]|jgi:hypothetical protein|nr:MULTISPECIES: IS5 family transposase [Clostridium]ALP88820.1 hypothetical protein ATN24_00975 [Clostridium butyricum]ALP89550.1 hypothetical protein ATN24_05195 [Clostridium butyricum]ALP90380.1 hypothetical protein ATN24_09575 [Clostridium butyricum]ALP90469.1 hypothetical protein ATN24_10065 [Clostridium butyricum]ALP90867.1 hypothetical protein ATN24_12205 [Clostridium butyricum]